MVEQARGSIAEHREYLVVGNIYAIGKRENSFACESGARFSGEAMEVYATDLNL
jgi:hypothetical protein